MTNHSTDSLSGSADLTRRQFVARAGTAAAGLTILSSQLAFGAEANSKIDIGLIGCGGRGSWIANLFVKNGHYNLAAVADYFQDRSDEVGQKHNVPAAKRFSGLAGYKRLLGEKLDAVVIETPPYFRPEQAEAAVAAGKHSYLAKPLAVDVPGCLSVAESGKKATAGKLVMLVDFQTRAHPAYQEVVKRVHAGGIGQLVSAVAEYNCNLVDEARDKELRKDPKNPELRLRYWTLDRVLSGDTITEQAIHPLDVATWFLNADPIKAYGTGGRARPYVGTCWDHFAVLFDFPNEVVLTFDSKQVGFGLEDNMCRALGMTGSTETHYGGKVWLKSREDGYNGDTTGVYTSGVEKNIATFYDNITQGECSNPTVAPSLRGTLTTILGRTAAYKNAEVTWADMMKANEKWDMNLKGLKS